MENSHISSILSELIQDEDLYLQFHLILNLFQFHVWIEFFSA